LSRTECSDDRRQIALTITARGRAVLKEAWSGTQLQMEAELRNLSDAERATLAEAMGILKGVFGSMGLPERTDCNGASQKQLEKALGKNVVIARVFEE
jgi:hypothetical protein